MLKFIIRRLLLLCFVSWGISVIVFSILLSFEPDKRAVFYHPNSNKVRKEDILRIKETYCMECPFHIQYGRWVKQICLERDFGYSVSANGPVIEVFWQRLPVTLELILFSFPLILLVGAIFGILAAVFQNSWIDYAARFISVLGWSLPAFLVGLLLLMLFYGYYQYPWAQPEMLSETAREITDSSQQFIRHTRMYTFDGLLNGKPEITYDALRRLILPILTEVFVIFALLARVMRASMLEVLPEGYMATAEAKGLSRIKVILKHALKNAMIPFTTVSGQLFAGLMTGSVSIEILFGRPGIGKWLADAAQQPDVPALIFCCLSIGGVYVLTNLVVDIMYAWLNPQIYYQ